MFNTINIKKHKNSSVRAINNVLKICSFKKSHSFKAKNRIMRTPDRQLLLFYVRLLSVLRQVPECRLHFAAYHSLKSFKTLFNFIPSMFKMFE